MPPFAGKKQSNKNQFSRSPYSDWFMLQYINCKLIWLVLNLCESLNVTNNNISLFPG